MEYAWSDKSVVGKKNGEGWEMGRNEMQAGEARERGEGQACITRQEFNKKNCGLCLN